MRIRTAVRVGVRVLTPMVVRVVALVVASATLVAGCAAPVRYDPLTAGTASPTVATDLTHPRGCAPMTPPPSSPSSPFPLPGAATGAGRSVPSPADSRPAPASGDVRAVSRWDDVRYAPVSPAQVFDLVVPAGAGPFPLIVKIHGGAFLGGDKASELSDVDLLTAAGYAVASLNYRLSCEALFPAAVQDVKAAVRHLRAHAGQYRLDPDRFAAWGESAGANLAAMLGATGTLSTFLDDVSLGSAGASSQVQAVVAWYGPYDFAAMDSDFENGRPAACPDVQRHDVADSPESLYLGAPVPTVRDLAAAAGPAPYLTAATSLPPFLLVAGDSDCLVPHQQSSTLHRLLLAAGGHSRYTLLPGVGHADPVFRATQTGPAVAFLDEVLGR